MFICLPPLGPYKLLMGGNSILFTFAPLVYGMLFDLARAPKTSADFIMSHFSPQHRPTPRQRRDVEARRADMVQLLCQAISPRQLNSYRSSASGQRQRTSSCSLNHRVVHGRDLERLLNLLSSDLLKPAIRLLNLKGRNVGFLCF